MIYFSNYATQPTKKHNREADEIYIFLNLKIRNLGITLNYKGMHLTAITALLYNVSPFSSYLSGPKSRKFLEK